MELCLHIGAHKTATTHLQMRLSAHLDALSARGVYHVPAGPLRETIEAAGGYQPGRRWLGGGLRDVFTRIADEAAAAGASRVVLSDENVPGKLSALLTPQAFYDEAGARVAATVRAWTRGPVTLFLSVRAYETLFISAWAHAQRRHGFRDFDDALRHVLLAKTRGWADMVADLRAAVPEARLTLWTYETWSQVEPDVLTALLGPAAASALTPPETKRMHWGLSARAVRRLRNLARDGEPLPPERIVRVHKRFGRWKGFAPFDPWTGPERTALQDRYRRDLAWLAKMPEVRWVNAPAPALQ